MPGDAPPAARSARAAAKKAPTAQKAPAAKKAPPKLGGTPGKVGRPSKAELRNKLQDSLEKLAGGLIVAGTMAGRPEWVYDGKVIQYQAPAIARELYKLAEANPTVRKALESLYSGAQQLDSLTTLLGTVVPILVAHGKLPQGALAIPGAGSTAMLDAIGPPPEQPQSPPLRLVKDEEGQGADEPPPPPPTLPWSRRRQTRPAPAPAPEPVATEPAPDLNAPAEDSTGVSLSDLSPGLDASMPAPLGDDDGAGA